MQFFLVPSASMAPTLLPEDHIVTFRQARYGHGDVVVLSPPDEDTIVKRIIAVEGDAVAIRDGAVYVNGKALVEPYIMEPINPKYRLAHQQVPQGSVFVLGDNRNHSEDSASYSESNPGQSAARFYTVWDVVGKVARVYLPLARFGPVNGHARAASAGP